MSKTREYFFIGDRGQGEGIEIMGGLWKFILKYAVLTASHFEAHFPNDPHLGEGRDEFLQLPKIKVEPWNGMKGAIAVKGEMTPEARALFLQIIETQFILLWDFMLFKDEQKLLSVSDYTDRIITEHFARDLMEKLFYSWFEPIPEPDRDIKSESNKSGELLEMLLSEMTKEITSMLEKEPSAD
nr:MAG: hypothetical protein DIU66_10770 [Bacillota bacterium]